MNYLAHFHLAGDVDGFVIGALLGDFIKGPLGEEQLQRQLDIAQFPTHTCAGIQLHRDIDGFFDNQVRDLFNEQAALSLPVHFRRGEGRRYLPIVLDLFFDHALSHSWGEHNELTLEQFSNQVLTQLRPFSRALPDKAQQLVSRLEQYELLVRYGDDVLMRQIAESIAARFSRPNSFMACYDQVMLENDFFKKYFADTYPLLQRYAGERITRLKNNRSRPDY